MIKILGIDPGFVNTGYGVITASRHSQLVTDYGTIAVARLQFADRLKVIHERLAEVISEFEPEEVVIERIFMHCNPDSALKLGHARGVAIATCAIKQLPIFEYTANQIKRAIVGRGHATKQQVQHMVRMLLSINQKLQTDAADALAIALCHAYSREGMMRMSKLQNVAYGRLR